MHRATRSPHRSASINVTGKAATWTDVDGDLVTLKWTAAMAPTFITRDQGVGLLVDLISVNAAAYANDALTVSVKAVGTGDGYVSIGRVDATGQPLKSFVGSKVNLLEIDCGNQTTAIGTLQLANYGLDNPSYFKNTGGNLSSDLFGSVGTAKVAGDLGYGLLSFGASDSTKIGTITIGGSLLGNLATSTQQAGALAISGAARSVTVGGSVFGGDYQSTGVIGITGSLASLKVGGDFVGGAGAESGSISGGDCGTVTVQGSVFGGTVPASGRFYLDSVKTLTIYGDVRGGTREGSGVVSVRADSGSITIRGSVVGGAVDSPTNDAPVGSIATYQDASLKSITIGHNLESGTVTNGSVSANGAVVVDGNLGSLTVGGSILGTNPNRALILVKGKPPATTADYNALGKLSVKGDATYALIKSGVEVSPATASTATNPGAGIGAVSIGGNYYHSSLMAGIDSAATSGVYPTDTHTPSARNSHLGPVVIGGFIGDDTAASGYSGFEAEVIASITVGGRSVYHSGDGVHYFDASHFVFAQEV